MTWMTVLMTWRWIHLPVTAPDSGKDKTQRFTRTGFHSRSIPQSGIINAAPIICEIKSDYLQLDIGENLNLIYIANLD